MAPYDGYLRQPMGMGFGLERPDTIFKRKFRWLLKIDGVSAQGVNALPPEKSARPSMSFKENEVQHISESVFFPGKPEWKPLNLTLYDINCNSNPVFDWLNSLYQPRTGKYCYVVNENFANQNDPTAYTGFKKNAELLLYDGCGDCIEKWRYENCYPQSVDWQDLDMGSSDILMVEVTLRYDRAYMIPCKDAYDYITRGQQPNCPW